jgi:hypothetical protein
MTAFAWVILVTVAVLVIVDSWMYAKREDEKHAGYQPKNPVDLDSVKMPQDES